MDGKAGRLIQNANDSDSAYEMDHAPEQNAINTHSDSEYDYELLRFIIPDDLVGVIGQRCQQPIGGIVLIMNFDEVTHGIIVLEHQDVTI